MSTDSDLQGIEDSFRQTLVFGGDPFGGLGWRADADTEEFVPGSSTRVPGMRRLTDAPVDIGGLDAFRTEIAALNMDPTLAALTGGIAIPAVNLPDVVDSVSMRADFSGTRVFWLPASAGVTSATLHFDFPLAVSLRAVDPIDEFFDLGTWRTPVNVDIAATPCGTCGGPPCTDAGLRTSAGYRTSIAESLGYASAETDVVYPDQGLNFTPTVTGSPRISGRVSYSALCPFSIGTLPPATLAAILPTVPGVEELINVLRGSVGSPLAFVAGVIGCTIASIELTRTVDPIVLGVPPSLQGAIDILVNPPTLARSLAGLPIPVALPAVVSTRATAGVALATPAAPGVPAVTLTNADGSYTDAFYSTVALGGTAAVTGVQLNLQPVIAACGAGVGVTPAETASCGACNPGGACVGGAACNFLCAPGGGFATTANVPAAAIAAVPVIAIASAPRTAALLSGAPYFAETVRRWFANPLPAGARYVSTAPSSSVPGDADFSYIVDPDGDCVSSEGDVCPGVFDPAQAETDGDAFGDACDLCQGLAASRPIDNEDVDADGFGNACDCDIDGDGCFNAGLDLATGMECPPPPPGARFDERPFSASSAEWDADGIPDACDPDQDNDGVPDELDNCPRGNGDDVFTPADASGSNDQDPDQTDSGGLSLGDLCDPLCPGPGAPGCSVPGPRAFEVPRGVAFYLPDLFPSGFECIFDGPGCGFVSVGACSPNDPGCLSGFSSVVGVGPLGGPAVSLGRPFAGPGGEGVSMTTTIDLDGDGLRDVALGAPGACLDGKQACDGAVVIVGTRTAAPIALLTQAGSDGRFGTALAVIGDVLAVGAPGTLDSRGRATGAVHLYRLGASAPPTLRRTFFGNADGERFGEHISTIPEQQRFLVSAPAASTTAIAAGRIDVIEEGRGVVASLHGSLAGGHVGRVIVLPRARAESGQTTSSGPIVVAAAPDANDGAGALYFFDSASGRARTIVRGAPGDHLGASLALIADAAGAGEIAAGAPGRRQGEGAIDRFGRDGRRLSVTSLPEARALGARMSAPGDVDGDGLRDIIVSLGLPDGGSGSLLVTQLGSPAR